MNGIELDAIGILEAVDKSSLRGDITCSWDYLRHYDKFFREFRKEPINIIEIGVANGASLNVWLRYFERANIIGVDIDPACARFARGRAEVRIGSQADVEFLRAIAEERPPTIVIDDGSHIAAHIVTSFETLFPLLAPGGVYVIEDLEFHYTADGQRIVPENLHEAEFPGVFANDLIQELIRARLDHVTDLALASDKKNQIYSEIDEIRVVGGMVAISKRKPRDVDAVVAALNEGLVEFGQGDIQKHTRGCFRVAEYLWTHGRYEEALKRADEGMASGLDDVYGMQVRRAILLSLGRVSEAKGVAAKIEGFGYSPDLPKVAKPAHMTYPHK